MKFLFSLLISIAVYYFTHSIALGIATFVAALLVLNMSRIKSDGLSGVLEDIADCLPGDSSGHHGDSSYHDSGSGD